MSVPRIIILDRSRYFNILLEEPDADAEESDEEGGIPDDEGEGDNEPASNNAQQAAIPSEGVEEGGPESSSSVEHAAEDDEDTDDEDSDVDVGAWEPIRYHSDIVVCRTNSPDLLQVCKEAQAEASKVCLACHERAVLNTVYYQPNVDIVLMEDPRIFHAFKYGTLRFRGYASRNSVSVTSVAIHNVDFRRTNLTPGLPRCWEWHPILIGRKITEYPNLNRITFIIKTGSTAMASLELVVPPTPKHLRRRRRDRDAGSRLAEDEYFAEMLGKTITNSETNQHAAFLLNVSFAVQVFKALTIQREAEPSPIVLECCTLEQLQARYE